MRVLRGILGRHRKIRLHKTSIVIFNLLILRGGQEKCKNMIYLSSREDSRATVIIKSPVFVVPCSTVTGSRISHLRVPLALCSTFQSYGVQVSHTSLVQYPGFPVVTWCPGMQRGSHRQFHNIPCIAKHTLHYSNLYYARSV